MNLLNLLTEVKNEMQGQRHIKTISVASNGVITIVYDNSLVSEYDVDVKMKEAGITSYKTNSDWLSDSIFVKL